MIKIFIFAAIQAFMYSIVAYVTFDLTWIISSGESGPMVRFWIVAIWGVFTLLFSPFVYIFE